MRAINTVKDLEGVKPFEQVNITYCYDKSIDANQLTLKSKGIFGGSFEVNNEKYLIISHPMQSCFFTSQYILTSYLYKIEDQTIINKMNHLRGYCDKEHSSLEEAIKRHVKTFNDDKLRELNRMDKENTN
jgi:hypothetical protein